MFDGENPLLGSITDFAVRETLLQVYLINQLTTALPTDPVANLKADFQALGNSYIYYSMARARSFFDRGMPGTAKTMDLGTYLSKFLQTVTRVKPEVYWPSAVLAQALIGFLNVGTFDENRILAAESNQINTFYGWGFAEREKGRKADHYKKRKANQKLLCSLPYNDVAMILSQLAQFKLMTQRDDDQMQVYHFSTKRLLTMFREDLQKPYRVQTTFIKQWEDRSGVEKLKTVLFLLAKMAITVALTTSEHWKDRLPGVFPFTPYLILASFVGFVLADRVRCKVHCIPPSNRLLRLAKQVWNNRLTSIEELSTPKKEIERQIRTYQEAYLKPNLSPAVKREMLDKLALNVATLAEYQEPLPLPAVWHEMFFAEGGLSLPRVINEFRRETPTFIANAIKSIVIKPEGAERFRAWFRGEASSHWPKVSDKLRNKIVTALQQAGLETRHYLGAEASSSAASVASAMV